MEVISADKFNQEIVFGNNKTEKIYKNKVLIQGPAFALDEKKSAIQYCQVYLQKNPQNICLLVQEKHYFQLWKEDSKRFTQTNQVNESLITLEDTTYEMSHNSDSSLLLVKNHQNIDADTLLEFINLCQSLLSQFIGPIGGIICEKISSQNPNISCQEFTIILAKKIPDPQNSLEFKETLLKFIEEKIGFNILLKEITKRLKNSSIEIDIIAALDLDKIVNQMSGIEGVKIKNRRYNLKLYANCFVGKEAVEWMTNNLNLSTKQAIKLGKRLIEEKKIYHVLNHNDFENKYLFYRFD